MPDWIAVGETVVNVNNIDYVERVNPALVRAYMSSGRVVEVTESMAVNLWNFIVSERLPFYDTVTPTRDFSGT